MKKQSNEYSNPRENNAIFLKRLFIYQKERFPILGHGLLVAAFTFSAISYSRICRGASNFVNWDIYCLGIFMTISLFLLLRIFDEFKDAEEDALFRKKLPVPRGLISFKELLYLGVGIVVLQILVNIVFFPQMLGLYFLVIGYLLLMGKEFFVANWLKKNQLWYVLSHMFIIPLIDIYASGLDWLLNDVEAPQGLMFFFAVSYMNGIVLEVGRKLRAPEQEETGVLTYSAMLGAKKASLMWIAVLFITLLFSIAAANYAEYGTTAFVILGAIFIVCAMQAILFLNKQTPKLAKRIELFSGVWTIAMYLTLGGIPMVQKLIM